MIVCPGGWHLPSQSEWTTLMNYVGGTTPPHGNQLKSCRQVNSPLGGDCNTTEHPRWNSSPNVGTDDYGFSGLPTGIRGSDGIFNNIGNTGHWWSATSSSGEAWYWLLSYFNAGVSQGYGETQRGFSVRCLKD